MSTTYAQHQTTAQKKDANTAASVVDSSSQAQSLQRKADLCNSPIQCYGMTPNFLQNHSSCSEKEAIARCKSRRQVNSVLTPSAQNRLNGATKANVTRIVGVDCVTWGYNYGVPRKIPEANHGAVVIIGGNMDHLESSGPRMVGREDGWIDYVDLH